MWAFFWFNFSSLAQLDEADGSARCTFLYIGSVTIHSGLGRVLEASGDSSLENTTGPGLELIFIKLSNWLVA